MAGRLNRKVLLFIGEYRTTGAGDLYLGDVVVLARDADRVDKCLSDLLEPGAGEIHASRLDDGYLQGLMQRLPSGRSCTCCNRPSSGPGSPSSWPDPCILLAAMR